MAFIVDHPELEANVIDPSLSTIQAERVGSTDVPVSKYGSSIRYNIGKFLWKKYPL